MNTHADKIRKPNNQAAQQLFSKNHRKAGITFQFADNRPETAVQRKLHEMANKYSAQQLYSVQRKENKTGLPDYLKSNVEDLSGYSMDDVKVHFNSDKPAQVQAHAFAQGTDIHLASGQEKHLPHETWHVVQQKQGRVIPTMQLQGSVNVNDDAGLEKEADVMGARAMVQRKTDASLQTTSASSKVIQRLSHELYDKAELRWSSRAFAHLSREQVEKFLWDNQAKITVGTDQTILIGDGLRTGYAVNGSIRYNCHYDENAGRHVIYVYHAHSHGRMG